MSTASARVPQRLASVLAALQGPLSREFPSVLRGGRWWQPRQGACSVVWVWEGATDSHVFKLAVEPFFAELLHREHTRLVALAGTGLPVPRVRALLSGDGVTALVTSQLNGTLARTRLRQETDPMARRRLLRTVGETLARIHATPVPPALRTDGSWLDRILREAAHNLARGYHDGGSADDLAELAAKRPAAAPEALIHGDFTLNNCLVAGTAVSGVIDWSYGERGDPRYDLCLAARYKPDAIRSRAELAHLFEGYGSPPPDPGLMAYFERLYEYF